MVDVIGVSVDCVKCNQENSGGGQYLIKNTDQNLWKKIYDECTPLNNQMLEYQKKASKLRLGYVPGVIRHYYHGTKQNRQYTERWKILMKHKYSPIEDVTYDNQGILVPTKKFSAEFKEEFDKFFHPFYMVRGDSHVIYEGA